MMKQMKKYLPDTKFVSAGVSGLIAWGLAYYFNMPDKQAMEVAAGISAAVLYVTPMTVNDVMRRGDLFIEHVFSALEDEEDKDMGM